MPAVNLLGTCFEGLNVFVSIELNSVEELCHLKAGKTIDFGVVAVKGLN